MVAKLPTISLKLAIGLNLAKIHMVAKPIFSQHMQIACLNLAKIHMVAKPVEIKKSYDYKS